METKALREEFSSLKTEIQSVIDQASTEKRDLTDDEKVANDKKFARLDAINSLVEAEKKLAGIAFSAKVENAEVKGDVVLPSEPKRGDFEFGSGADIRVVERKPDRDEFSAALRNWAVTGRMDQKFATITTATASSILLPKSVLSPLVTGAANAFRQAFAAYGMNPMQTPGNTATFNLPIIDPTAGGLVAENAGSETENAPSFSESIVSTAKTYQSGSVYYSNLQLSATPFDLLSNTVPNLQFNKELGLESAVAAAMIADSGITQVVNTSSTTAGTWQNYQKLNRKLPKRYQSQQVILLSKEGFDDAESLADSQNRPIMSIDVQRDGLTRMWGTPVFRCDYLEAFGASKVIGLVLSLTGFHLRDAGEGIIRYDQVPAKPNQTGINLFGYHAYGYAVSAVAKLKTPAT